MSRRPPRAARAQLDAGVDVLGVLAEDDHVDLLGVPAPGRARRGTSAPGRRQTYRSSTWRRATLRLRMPPPTGVVSGPLMPTRYCRKASSGLLGQPLAGLA